MLTSSFTILLSQGPEKRLDKLMYQNEVLRQGLKSASALYGQQLSEAKAHAQMLSDSNEELRYA